MVDTLPLYCHVPVCSFRPRWAREYQESHELPPPSTVYGMLLSLIGVPWDQKDMFQGIRMALAIESEPERARVLRKFRRVPRSKSGADALAARRPDHQELLLWLSLWIWLQDGESDGSLIGEVRRALGEEAHRIQRHSALSLGESSHLVDELSIREPNCEGRFLQADKDGRLVLPVWVAHQRSPEQETRIEHFELTEKMQLSTPEPDSLRWITVTPA